MNKLSKTISQKKFSKKYIAEKASISRTHLYYIEKGMRNPSMKTMKRLSNILGKSIEEIFF